MNGRGWSAVGERIFQALRHLETKQVFCNNHIMKRIDPHRPNTPFYSKMEKILCLILKKKHSHRGSSLRDSPKWTEITTYPGYHVHISCDDLRSTDLGNNLGKLQPCHALLWVSWHHAGTWRSNLDSWIYWRQVCGETLLSSLHLGRCRANHLPFFRRGHQKHVTSWYYLLFCSEVSFCVWGCWRYAIDSCGVQKSQATLLDLKGSQQNKGEEPQGIMGMIWCVFFHPPTHPPFIVILGCLKKKDPWNPGISCDNPTGYTFYIEPVKGGRTGETYEIKSLQLEDSAGAKDWKFSNFNLSFLNQRKTWEPQIKEKHGNDKKITKKMTK